MADKPILFSAPMVQALLAGTKTQTRRALSPQPYSPESVVKYDRTAGKWMSCEPSPVTGGTRQMDPWRPLRIKVGDRLYVREAWRTWAQYDRFSPSALTAGTHVAYEATESPNLGDNAGRYRQGMHMPRWASRLTLTVTDVRVERLQDISDEDAEAEGCPPCEDCHGVGWINSGPDGGWQCTAPFCGDAYRDQYARLWDEINGSGAWESNPWVAAYTFTVHHGNIDVLREASK